MFVSLAIIAVAFMVIPTSMTALQLYSSISYIQACYSYIQAFPEYTLFLNNFFLLILCSLTQIIRNVLNQGVRVNQ